MPAADLAGAARRRVLFAVLCVALVCELALIAVVGARGEDDAPAAPIGPPAPVAAPAATEAPPGRR